jgi:membrane-associated phospholipid phosphatase
MKGKHLLLAAALVQFGLFIPVALWARKHPHPPLELGATRIFQHKRSDVTRTLVKGSSTIIGSGATLTTLVTSTALLLWRRNLRLEAAFTVGISCSNLLVRLLIGQLIDRPRPSPLLVAMSDRKQTKSFPSGHVCSSVEFWGWLAAMSLLRGKAPWHKTLAGFAALCLVYVGPSRIYLGDHWVTDVVGGYLFSGGWLALAVSLYLICYNRQK